MISEELDDIELIEAFELESHKDVNKYLFQDKDIYYWTPLFHYL